MKKRNGERSYYKNDMKDEDWRKIEDHKFLVPIQLY